MWGGKNRHCRICGEPGVASCRRGSSNSLGSKTGEENFERSRKSRLDILEAASAGDCISDCNGLWYGCAHQIIAVH